MENTLLPPPPQQPENQKSTGMKVVVGVLIGAILMGIIIWIVLVGISNVANQGEGYINIYIHNSHTGGPNTVRIYINDVLERQDTLPMEGQTISPAIFATPPGTYTIVADATYGYDQKTVILSAGESVDVHLYVG